MFAREIFDVNGGKLAISVSVPHKDFPEKSGVVRAEILLAAWLLVCSRIVEMSNWIQEKDGNKGTKCTYINHADLKGWIPTVRYSLGNC